MDKVFKHNEIEEKIYKRWLDNDCFTPKIDYSKKPFTIVLPPPNASGDMHIGNVLMIAIEDLLIRYKKMKGFNTLWVPGTDHAGFETQITYERKLKKEGKSRLDFDRNTLYEQIKNFVYENKANIENQIKSMGAAVDWTRNLFTLDERVLNTVFDTFSKMHKDGLVYRDDYMVNYCNVCGTTFADLETKHIKQKTPLYYIKYYFKDSDDYITVATTRPEPIYVDTHLAINPKDEKKKHLLNKVVLNPLTNKEMTFIEDEFVDMDFGTGIVKLTPAHDKNDYEVAKKHNLPIIKAFDLNGKMINVPEEVKGLYVTKARKVVVDILEKSGHIEKVDNNYENVVTVCYKGDHIIEPTILPNWFVKVESLKKPALDVVLNNEVKIFPKWRKITYIRWMEEMKDWAISRQVVWGIRIPVWYDVDKNHNLQVTFIKNSETYSGEVAKLLKDHSFEEIRQGLQILIAPKDAEFVISKEMPTNGRYLQETDTFDTWFSSGQWPLVTLDYPDGEDFKYFYPTSVLETGWEIIRLWVSRMIMFGIYLTNKPPFEYVYLHGLVRAVDGKKMSKSLGNVIQPEQYQKEYGTDALRMGLISGTATGKDFAFPHDKVLAYRNFGNKLWNMARFINLMLDKEIQDDTDFKLHPGLEEISELQESDREIIEKFNELLVLVDKKLENFRFSEAAESIYHFMWDELASNYIESVKNREDKHVALSVLVYIFKDGLKILHPFMPFVTEEIWSHLPNNSDNSLLVNQSWPVIKEL